MKSISEEQQLPVIRHQLSIKAAFKNYRIAGEQQLNSQKYDVKTLKKK